MTINNKQIYVVLSKKPKMKLSDKIIEQVVSESVGQDAVQIVKALKNKKNISEFKISEQIKLEVNTIRNILYRLYDENLVTFIRKKDKVKGWYIYYWTFNPKRIKDLIKILKKKKLEKLKERLVREKSSDFFACKNNCIRLDFDQATEFEFKCPECGNLLNQEDNKKIMIDIEKSIKSLEKESKEKK